MKFYYKAIW